MVCTTVPLFRRRAGMEAPGFRIPGGTAVAGAGLVFCLWLLSTRSFAQAGILARVHPRFRTPDAAIYAFAACGLAFALSGGFAANATISAIIRLVTYGMVCTTVPLFRRRAGMEAPGFRIPGGTAVAGAGLVFCLWLLSTRSFAQAGILAVLMAAGWLLGLASGRKPAPGGA
jgi:amino acid transporter